MFPIFAYGCAQSQSQGFYNIVPVLMVHDISQLKFICVSSVTYSLLPIEFWFCPSLSIVAFNRMSQGFYNIVPVIMVHLSNSNLFCLQSVTYSPLPIEFCFSYYVCFLFFRMPMKLVVTQLGVYFSGRVGTYCVTYWTQTRVHYTSTQRLMQKKGTKSVLN